MSTPESIIADLRRRVGDLQTERDRARDERDQVRVILDAERGGRRHALGLHCDKCGWNVSVTSSEPPPAAGLHARAIWKVALSMGFELSRRTRAELADSGAGSDVAFGPAGEFDLCAACRSERSRTTTTP